MRSNLPIETKLTGANGGKSGNTPEHTKGLNASGDVAGKGSSVERVANLPLSFDLSNALDKAYNKVVHYMNGMLDSKDLEVSIAVNENTEVGYVKDKLTGEKVSSYDGKEMLRLYAHNHQLKGIVVDGKV